MKFVIDQPVMYKEKVWYIKETLSNEEYKINRYCENVTVNSSELRNATLKEIRTLAPKHKFVFLGKPCTEESIGSPYTKEDIPEYYGKTIIRTERVAEQYCGAIINVSPADSEYFIKIAAPCSAPSLEDLTDTYVAYSSKTHTEAFLKRKVSNDEEIFIDEYTDYKYSRDELAKKFDKVYGMFWQWSTDDIPSSIPFLILTNNSFVLINDGKPADTDRN